LYQKEVQPLASSRATQNQIDLTDIAIAWAAFEEINQVTVTIACGMAPRKGVPEPVLDAIAWDNKTENTEAKPSALANARCWAFGYRSLDTAVFHLLYTLDGRLAEQELANAGKKEA
jgi:hypothetical protein